MTQWINGSMNVLMYHYANVQMLSRQTAALTLRPLFPAVN